MPYPVGKVYIAFSDGPFVASPTWTEVTSYVRSVTTDRGRSDDWGPFQGNAVVELDNRDRRFDPYYTSGPYYGNLLPRRQIKIEATYSGTTYGVFRGFIAGWPSTWTDAGKDATVSLSCFDLQQIMATEQGPADWAAKYIVDTWNPRHFYKLNEPIEAGVSAQTLKDSGTNPQDMTTYDVVQPGPQLYAAGASTSLGGASKLVGISLTKVADGGLTNTTTMTQASASVMFWFEGTPLLRIEFNNFVWFIQIVYNANGTAYADVTLDNVNTQWACRTDDMNLDQSPHHLAVVMDNATKVISLYVDGINYARTTTTPGGGLTPRYEQIQVWNGTVSQVVIKTGTTPQAEIQELIDWSRLAHKEKTYHRMKRLADLVGIPSGMYDLNSTSNAWCLDITGNAPYIGPETQIVADTESAPLFCAKNGKLTFYNSTTIFTQTKSTVSQATYGSGGLPMGTQISIWPDGDSIRNQVNVQMSQGGVQQYKDATSITNYGASSVTWVTQAAAIHDADISGDMIRDLGKNVYPQTTPISVVLSPNENWASTLGLELCERITVATAPPTGNTISLPMLVQRIRHTITPERWETTLEGSNRWAQSYTP